MRRFRFRPWLALAALLLALLVVSFIVFYVQQNRQSTALDQASGTAAGSSMSFGGSVKDFFGRLFASRKEDKDYAALKIRVQQLELQKDLMQDLELENKRLTNLRSFKEKFPNLKTVPARVIKKDPQGSWFIGFDLNMGTDMGVSKGDVVVNEDGLIGRVVNVDTDSCTVMSLLDMRSSVSVMIQRTTDPGIVDGAGEPRSVDVSLGVYELPVDAEITPDDVVVTSELGGYFPRGISVGSVTYVGTDDKLQRYALMKPSVDFARIMDVLIIIMSPTKPQGTQAAGSSPSPSPAAAATQQASAKPSAQPSQTITGEPPDAP